MNAILPPPQNGFLNPVDEKRVVLMRFRYKLLKALLTRQIIIEVSEKHVQPLPSGNIARSRLKVSRVTIAQPCSRKCASITVSKRPR